MIDPDLKAYKNGSFLPLAR